MEIEILPVGQMRTNCYLLYDKKNDNQGIIIDPGDDGEFLINRLQELSIKPRAILATHGHFDHILSVMELKIAYQIPFFAHKGDSALINRMEQTAQYFIGEKVGPAPKVDKYLKNNDKIDVGEISLEIIETPGHSEGSVCYWEKKSGIVFVGDTIFAQGSRGRTDFLGGNSTKLAESIKRILLLPLETVIYSGHGEKSMISEEKRFYRFLGGKIIG